MTATRFEMEVALKEAFSKVFPKPVKKMKKEELAQTLAAFESWQSDKSKLPEPTPIPPRAPRAVKTTSATVSDTTIAVPEVPAKRVMTRSSAAEKAAYRAEHPTAARSIALPADFPTKPRGRPKKVTIATEPAAGAGVASAEDDDPRASRIVKAHKAPTSAVASDPTLPKKPHRCNCPHCDKKGMTF